jgi:hypothetical protein
MTMLVDSSGALFWTSEPNGYSLAFNVDILMFPTRIKFPYNHIVSDEYHIIPIKITVLPTSLATCSYEYYV